MENNVIINQTCAILIDGNNIERSIHSISKDTSSMLNFDTIIPRLLVNRGLNRLVYFREGKNISSKLSERLHTNYHGSVRPCHKSADIPLSIKATQLANKVDTVIIMSGDSDYIELVRHLKNEGVRVEIAAIPDTTSGMLIEEADYFHPITKEDWFSFGSKKSPVKKTTKKTIKKTIKKTTKKKTNKKA
ncbi:NYN domain-containing protein [Bacteriovoracaceae bacterium]|nr:NYN domain-containing protein [Bacteriovoracaceae bacterium]